MASASSNSFILTGTIQGDQVIRRVTSPCQMGIIMFPQSTATVSSFRFLPTLSGKWFNRRFHQTSYIGQAGWMHSASMLSTSSSPVLRVCFYISFLSSWNLRPGCPCWGYSYSWGVASPSSQQAVRLLTPYTIWQLLSLSIYVWLSKQYYSVCWLLF